MLAPPGKPVRLVLLANAPMYYHAPLYRLLAQERSLDFCVLFASDAGVRPHDIGHGKPVRWDVDALSGYRHAFLRRAPKEELRPGFTAHRDPSVVPAIVRARPDVLWLHGYNSFTHALALATQRLYRTPLLLREEQNDLDGPREGPHSQVRRVVLRHIAKGSRALVIGTANREWFQDLGVSAERCHSAPYAVDNARLRAAATALASEREDLRRRLGLTGPAVVLPARLIDKKDPLTLLRAFARVRERLACSLLFAGAGPLEPVLQREVAALRVPDVHFLGFVEQSRMPEIYTAADVMCLPSSHNETWGLVVNEAMNFALPVVTSTVVGSSRDLVQPGRTGYTFAPRDVETLARHLSVLIQSSSQRAELGAEARRRVAGWSHEVARDGVLSAVRASVGLQRWRAASVASA